MGFNQNFGNIIFDNLTFEDDFRSKRISSWDKTGGNADFIKINANQKKILANINGSGSIRHMYSTSLSLDPYFYRNLLLRIYWDGEQTPSVEVPFGDFFGIGHCKPMIFNSLMLSVNPGNVSTAERRRIFTYGLNCYFPMPFSKSAVIEIENQSEIPIEAFWYHIDYQEFDSLDDKIFRFHALFNREKLTKVNDNIKNYRNMQLCDIKNIDGKDNYNILDINGNGKFAGFILNVDNIAGGWWGEGDDMVFIDEDTWPPSLHGTGTEEIFGGGACPSKEYNTPYCGFHLISNNDYYRQNSMYRFFIVDPIRFKKSIKYTIEHGHANNFENDYSSVAFWYQKEPHEFEFKSINPEERWPLKHSVGEKESIENQVRIVKSIYEKKGNLLGYLLGTDIAKLNLILGMLNNAENLYFEGRYDKHLNIWKSIEKMIL